ncbi:hypothetical protein [Nannocystis pusilla]|uniref:hypothetical protein n=1 Tax=Nannocystis pusilla TaxID=889268 RepID=UPI003B817030
MDDAGEPRSAGQGLGGRRIGVGGRLAPGPDLARLDQGVDRGELLGELVPAPEFGQRPQVVGGEDRGIGTSASSAKRVCRTVSSQAWLAPGVGGCRARTCSRRGRTTASVPGSLRPERWW